MRDHGAVTVILLLERVRMTMRIFVRDLGSTPLSQCWLAAGEFVDVVKAGRRFAR